MAVVHLKSAPVTNLDATPKVKVNSNLMHGEIREAAGFITTNADDSIGSTYRMCRVPSDARVSQVLGSADVGSAGAGIADVGLYQTAENGGAVVDADLFASAWDFSDADATNVDLTHEAAAGASFLVNEMEQRIWQVLGLSADPNREYDVTLTLTEAVTTGAAVVGIRIRYVRD